MRLQVLVEVPGDVWRAYANRYGDVGTIRSALRGELEKWAPKVWGEAIDCWELEAERARALRAVRATYGPAYAGDETGVG